MTAQADKARDFIESDTFTEAMANLRAEYRRIMEDHRTLDADVLESRRMLHLSQRFEAHVQQIIANGKLDDFNAQEKERPSFLGDIVKWPNKTR